MGASSSENFSSQYSEPRMSDYCLETQIQICGGGPFPTLRRHDWNKIPVDQCDEEAKAECTKCWNEEMKAKLKLCSSTGKSNHDQRKRLPVNNGHKKEIANQELNPRNKT
jgi:hypothetical protein